MSQHSRKVWIKETLPTVWRHTSGKFDDGIAVVHPEPEAKADDLGPHFLSLMNLFGVTRDDIENNYCMDCKQHHERKARRCQECEDAHVARGNYFRR